MPSNHPGRALRPDDRPEGMGAGWEYPMPRTAKPTTLGQRIRAARDAAGLSRRAIAIQLGVDQQSIYRWETDANLPSVETLSRLAKLLGTTAGRLLDG